MLEFRGGILRFTAGILGFRAGILGALVEILEIKVTDVMCGLASGISCQVRAKLHKLQDLRCISGTEFVCCRLCSMDEGVHRELCGWLVPRVVSATWTMFPVLCQLPGPGSPCSVIYLDLAPRVVSFT